jgi:hypothetical protein
MTAAAHLHNLEAMGAPPEGTPAYAAWAAQDLRPTILAVLWSFLALCALFVGLRLYVRLRVYRRLLEDDWWLVAGMTAGLFSAILATVAVSFGNGRHMPALTADEAEKVVLWTTLSFCPGVFFFGLPKLAVLTLLCRLLDPKKWLRRFFWTIIVVSQMSSICLIGLIMGRCRPFTKLYRPQADGYCLEIDIVADFGVYVGGEPPLPLPQPLNPQTDHVPSSPLRPRRRHPRHLPGRHSLPDAHVHAPENRPHRVSRHRLHRRRHCHLQDAHHPGRPGPPGLFLYVLLS